MPKLTIDHREIDVPAGTKVIEAAERLGIMIPRFCYHPALGSVGACRVCAVAFTDGPVKGIQMSCMVNAQDQMVVSTTDGEAMDFRRHVIEWLMLNHPHDCPVCDEGGHCLLQDLTVSGGHGRRRYEGLKRTHQDQYLGPLIQHEMNRCIHCYRCARYYQTFAGANDLGVMGIGARVYFGRSRSGTLESPFSGNLIDICPTGVYTDKPSRFMGRRWDFERAPSVCVHCSLGCNLVVSARYRRLVRHEARPNMEVNGYFICDRGRYGYPYAEHPDRPRQALAKGTRQALPDAIASARQALADITTQYGPQSVAAIGSVRSSLETVAVLAHQCGAHHWTGPVIAQETRRAENLSAAIGSLSVELAVSLGALSVAESVLVIGADPINEAPLLALTLREAQRRGGYVAVLDPRGIEMPLEYDHLPVSPSEMGAVLKQMICAAASQAEEPAQAIPPSPTTAAPTPWDDRLGILVSRLCSTRRAVIVCGTDITTAQEIALAAELARALRRAGTEAKLFYLLEGPNAYAAGRMTEDVMGIEGLLDQIETGRVKALVVVENDLWRNHPDRERLIKALDQLELFILLDHEASPLTAQADLFLPTQSLYEAGGHWVNQEGRVQSALPVLAGGASIEAVGKGGHPPRVFETTLPDGAPAAAWQLLGALLDSADVGDVDQPKAVPAAAMDRAKSRMGEVNVGKRVTRMDGSGFQPGSAAKFPSGSQTVRPDGITLLLVDWTFGTEALSLSSPPLAQIAPQPVALLHSKTAEGLGFGSHERVTITTNQGQLSLVWRSDDRMAPGVIVVPRHHLLEWQVLGGTRLELSPGQIRPTGS
jgi:NADH-quinone oxidoreductase subunit G